MTKQQGAVASVLVFDVNETLLDVSALRPRFEKLFGEGAVLKQWFAQLLLYSQTMTQVNQYADFGVLADAALRMVAESHNVALDENEASDIVQALGSLPPHPEVADALRRLREHGFRTVALTNSSQATAHKQIEHAGLATLFDRVFSVEAVRTYKPAPEPYRYVAQDLAIEPSRLTMIAAHPWDLIGASACGYKAALVQRFGTAWFPLVSAPDFTGRNLNEVADQLIRAEQRL